MALGFSTQQSLRHAIQAGHVPFPTFTLKGRKGPFARTHDVAAWLASHASDPVALSPAAPTDGSTRQRSEENTSELQSLMRNSYAVLCLKKKNKTKTSIRT